MIGRIVEVADNHRHLSVYRGFMVVSASHPERSEIARIPLDDVTAVIAVGHGFTYTNNLLVALAKRGAPFVLCGSNHNPVGMLLSTEGNFEQTRRIEAQISATKPVKKRLWTSIVKAKILQQATTLQSVGAPCAPLHSLSAKVRSGDPQNIEALAAKRYWHLLFGGRFRRDRHAEDINSYLNYGYMIMRAGCARAVISAGLHPSLGINHCNAGNAFTLVDDLIEPFRPLVDLCVWGMREHAHTSITSETKKKLATLLHFDLKTDQGLTPVSVCMQRLAVSLAQVFLKQRNTLDLPSIDRPVEWTELVT